MAAAPEDERRICPDIVISGVPIIILEDTIILAGFAAMITKLNLMYALPSLDRCFMTNGVDYNLIILILTLLMYGCCVICVGAEI